jgi:hypothetical protein
MIAQLMKQPMPGGEQRLVLPATHAWQELQALKSVLGNMPGVRVAFLDGSLNS